MVDSAPGKSPGLDGFTTYYYKKFKDILTPKLCHFMNGLGIDFELSRGLVVIPKEGKDGTLCSSYRPIFLINADVKLFARVLASCLKGLMGGLIHPDQVGFTPRREGRDNGMRTLLQNIKEKGPPGLLLSIDAEKAFDRVDWGVHDTNLKNSGSGSENDQVDLGVI